MNSVRVGTSGWSYPTGRGTWNGLFYPERGTRGFRAADELAYYAEHFDTVEVNSTFYRPPAAATTARWVAQTPPGFEFSLKLHQQFTHTVPIGHEKPARDERGHGPSLPQPAAGAADEFKAGLEPIARSGKLGALLVQFPPSFHHGPDSLEYVEHVLETFREYPVAVELRHRSWSDASADTMDVLDRFQAAWVQIDEPKFRLSIRQDLVPNIERFYYLRLHGRNAAQWWSPEAAEDRYNYLYSAEELRPFADVVTTVRSEVTKAYLYLNNHFAAKAVVNAAVLRHQLGQPVTGEYRPEMLAAYPELRAIAPPQDDGLFDTRPTPRT
jgi:uncharacterized protein YecE (DUF72 family)